MVDGWWNFPKVPGRSRDNHGMSGSKFKWRHSPSAILDCGKVIICNYEVFPIGE